MARVKKRELESYLNRLRALYEEWHSLRSAVLDPHVEHERVADHVRHVADRWDQLHGDKSGNELWDKIVKSIPASEYYAALDEHPPDEDKVRARASVFAQQTSLKISDELQTTGRIASVSALLASAIQAGQMDRRRQAVLVAFYEGAGARQDDAKAAVASLAAIPKGVDAYDVSQKAMEPYGVSLRLYPTKGATAESVETAVAKEVGNKLNEVEAAANALSGSKPPPTPAGAKPSYRGLWIAIGALVALAAIVTVAIVGLGGGRSASTPSGASPSSTSQPSKPGDQGAERSKTPIEAHGQKTLDQMLSTDAGQAKLVQQIKLQNKHADLTDITKIVNGLATGNNPAEVNRMARKDLTAGEGRALTNTIVSRAAAMNLATVDEHTPQRTRFNAIYNTQWAGLVDPNVAAPIDAHADLTTIHNTAHELEIQTGSFAVAF